MISDSLQRDLDRHYSYENSEFVRYTHRLRINRLRQLITDLADHQSRTEGRLALDAGCSNGVYSILLAEAGYRVTAIDIDEEALRFAGEWATHRSIQNRIEFLLGDIQNLNVKGSTFDLVVCSEVLEHLDEPIRGARELFRVLKSDGMAIISMPNMFCLLGFIQWAYRVSGIRSMFGKPPLDTFQIQHSRYWFGNILNILRDTGFRIEQKYSSCYIPYMWKLDAFLEKVNFGGGFFVQAEEWIGRWPIFRCLGYNFIVVARKT